MKKADRREKLLVEIRRLADVAIFGTLSTTYRTCGQPTCRCHGDGPKHGPHLGISYRGEDGKTASYYVPKAAEPPIRKGVEAWEQLKLRLRQLADINKDNILAEARQKRRA